MSSQISCRNVVKVKFDGKSDSVGTEPKESEKSAPPTASKSSPMLHPSLSIENLTLSAGPDSGKPEQCASPLRSSATKPPREKQLHSIKLLIEQHNNEVEVSDDQGFMFLIDAEWLNAWHRFALSNDPALYPGAISNWSLIAASDEDEDTQDNPTNNTTYNTNTSSTNALAGGSSANSLTSPSQPPSTAHSNSTHSSLTAAALAHRRKAMRGLSFDGEECDFAEELEHFQQRAQQLQQAAGSPAKQAQAQTTEETTTSATTNQVDYDYLTCQFRLHRLLREDIDYYLLPHEAWQALHGWYGGGPPLPRGVSNTLNVRTIVPCSVGHLLLQLPANPNFESVLAQESEGFVEGSAIHSGDLYPLQLPCVQDVLAHYNTNSASNSVFNFPTSPFGRMSSFVSNASFDTSLSTLSLPSMADLTVASAHANHTTPTGTTTTPNTTTTNPSTNTTTNTTTTTTTKPKTKSLGTTCHVCKRSAMTRCSKCGSIFYCSRECQALHWKFHKPMCAKIVKKRLLQSLEAQKQKDGIASTAITTSTTTPTTTTNTTNITDTTPPSTLLEAVNHDRAGKVGLANLGNSCYMNSSLQCLSHIKPLTLAFLSRRIMCDLNVENRDGSGGKLAEQYALLLEQLWFETKRSVSPHLLKATLGRINSEYAGLAQQDAHELIELLLDKLHEDLNRVRSKPYTEKVEWDGVSSEQSVAEKAWFTHGLREDSCVRDVMGSLMRYQLTCPDCNKVSLSYEYHTTLQVAIPRRNTITRRVVFVPQIVGLGDVQYLLAGNSTTDTKGDKLSVLKAVLQHTTPLVFDISLDRLCVVRSLRDAVHKRLPAAHLTNTNTSNTNTTNTTNTTTYKASDLLLVESAHPNCSAVNRILRDAQAVAKLNEEAVIYAFCPPQATPHMTIVFQRVFDPLTEDITPSTATSTSTDTTTDSTSTPSPNTTTTTANKLDWKSLLRTSLVGFPLLVSYDSAWSCSRLRYQVLLNSLRLFRPGCAFLQRAGAALEGGSSSLLEQFKLANELPLRLTDQHGTSTTTAYRSSEGSSGGGKDVSLDKQVQQVWLGAASVGSVGGVDSSSSEGSNSTGSDEALHDAWTSACLSLRSADDTSGSDSTSTSTSAGAGKSDVEILFGSLLPAVKGASIEEFGGVGNDNGQPNNIIFLSLDVMGEKRAMFNHQQMQQLFPQSTTSTNPNSATTNTNNKGGITLHQCLQEHTKQEVLEAGNEVYCAQCKEHKCLTKVVRFVRPHLPRVLVLSLKRFEFREVSGVAGMYGGGAHREKIDTFVDFPIDGLDLAPFCQEESGSGSGDGSLGSVVSGSTIYDLFAVCNHYGRMGFGHYTASARDWEHNTNTNTSGTTNTSSSTSTTSNTTEGVTGLSKQWFVYDDNDVTGPCTPEEVEQEVHSRNAYILFYKQRGAPATFD